MYSVTCIVSDMKLQNFTLLGHSTCGAYDAGYCYECSVVCARVSVCLCVGHIAEHAEKADANRDTICDVDYGAVHAMQPLATSAVEHVYIAADALLNTVISCICCVVVACRRWRWTCLTRCWSWILHDVSAPMLHWAVHGCAALVPALSSHTSALCCIFLSLSPL